MVSIQGPVEDINGTLTLRIPLDAGGEDLMACAKGIGKIDGGFLVVQIPDWLAEKLHIVAGCTVAVNNRDGKFNIQRTNE